jgi:hypothetical protein
MNTSPIDGGFSPHELVYGTSTAPPADSEKVEDKGEGRDGRNKVLREEIAELVEEIHRGRRARSTNAVPDDLEPPPPTIGVNPDEDTDDSEGDGAIGMPQGGANNLDSDDLTKGQNEGSAGVGPGTGNHRESEGSSGDVEEIDFDRSPGSAKRIIMTVRQLRRVMAAKESLFKFGTFVPRSEREAADASPKAPRWRAGRDLKWFRL